MEMVSRYLSIQCVIPKRKPLPFPEYLLPHNKWDNDFWITKEGECVFPSEMRDQHLMNTINKIHRSTFGCELREYYDASHSDRYILNGVMVHDEYKQSKKRMPMFMRNYRRLWEDNRIYMLLRRELKLRQLEEYINET